MSGFNRLIADSPAPVEGPGSSPLARLRRHALLLALPAIAACVEAPESAPIEGDLRLGWTNEGGFVPLSEDRTPVIPVVWGPQGAQMVRGAFEIADWADQPVDFTCWVEVEGTWSSPDFWMPAIHLDEDGCLLDWPLVVPSTLLGHGPLQARYGCTAALSDGSSIDLEVESTVLLSDRPHATLSRR